MVVWGYLVYCMFVFFCTVTDFSAVVKGRGVKFCMRVFSHFGELWLTGNHGGGITSGMYAATNRCQEAAAPGEV